MSSRRWPNTDTRSLLFLTLLLPATAIADDLLAVYNAARDNDPRFRAAEANYRAGLQKLPEARALLLPTVSASARQDEKRDKTLTDGSVAGLPAGSASYDATTYSLSLSQPVFNAVAFAGLRQAHADVRRVEAEHSAAQQDLMLRTAQAYFELLAAQDNLEFARAEKTAIARNLELAEGRLQVGLATITDVHDARARHESAQAQEIEAENQLDDKREALRELTARRPESLVALGEALPLITPEPADAGKWIAIALDQNYALIAKRETQESAREEVKRLRAGHYPSLDIVGSRTHVDTDGSVSGPAYRTDNRVVGLQLTVPLLQGGLVSARTTEAAHRYTAAQEEYETTRRATERAARAAYLGVASGAARVQALKQAVTAGQSALDAKTEGFQAGINTSLDVLDAARDLYRAKRDYAQGRYTYLINLLKLKQAAGTLAEADLAQVNGWLK
ncbi:MAG: type I secretion protein TolC [Gammaproteobacteria bacterium]|nr:MAG: type I secretion protein TolC [Gammaproteobacteria bacterium]